MASLLSTIRAFNVLMATTNLKKMHSTIKSYMVWAKLDNESDYFMPGLKKHRAQITIKEQKYFLVYIFARKKWYWVQDQYILPCGYYSRIFSKIKVYWDCGSTRDPIERLHQRSNMKECYVVMNETKTVEKTNVSFIENEDETLSALVNGNLVYRWNCTSDLRLLQGLDRRGIVKIRKFVRSSIHRKHNLKRCRVVLRDICKQTPSPKKNFQEQDELLDVVDSTKASLLSCMSKNFNQNASSGTASKSSVEDSDSSDEALHLSEKASNSTVEDFNSSVQASNSSDEAVNLSETLNSSVNTSNSSRKALNSSRKTSKFSRRVEAANQNVLSFMKEEFNKVPIPEGETCLPMKLQGMTIGWMKINSLETLEQDYTCAKCLKIFSCSSRLAYHFRLIHMGSKRRKLIEEKVKCPYCNYSHSVGFMKRHIYSKHFNNASHSSMEEDSEESITRNYRTENSLSIEQQENNVVKVKNDANDIYVDEDDTYVTNSFDYLEDPALECIAENEFNYKSSNAQNLPPSINLGSSSDDAENLMFDFKNGEITIRTEQEGLGEDYTQDMDDDQSISSEQHQLEEQRLNDIQKFLYAELAKLSKLDQRFYVDNNKFLRLDAGETSGIGDLEECHNDDSTESDAEHQIIHVDVDHFSDIKLEEKAVWCRSTN